MTSLDEETAQAVLRQLEFYFSDGNIPTDEFLRRKISESSDAMVSLALICSFKRMKEHLNMGNVKPEDIPESTLTAVAEKMVNSVRLPRHIVDKRLFCGTALIEFSTVEDAEKVLKQSLVYAGVGLELKPKRDFDAERAKETQEFEKSHPALGFNRKNQSNREANYPKGLIVAFSLKNKSAGGSDDKNGSHKRADDSACKTDREPDSSENAVAEESERKASENDNSGQEKVEEKDESDGEEGDKTSGSSIEKGEEKEGNSSIDTYKDNMDVVMREDLKSVFQKFGTVKFIDFKIGAESGYIRFEEPEGAQKACAAAVLAEKGSLSVKNFLTVLEPVTGEAEKEYWSLLRGNQERHRDFKGNRGRGRKPFRGGRNSRFRENDSARGHPNKAQKVRAA